MNQWNIQQWSLIDTGLTMLSKWCNLSDDVMVQVDQNIQNTLVQIWLTLTKDSAPEYYTAYQQWHEAAATYRDLTQYCAYKIAAYQIQKRFYMVYEWKAKPINPVRTSYDYRVSYFSALKNMNTYTASSWVMSALKISVANRAQVLKLHPITKKVATEMSSLYRGVIAYSLQRLKDDSVLTQSDIATIWPKIIFNYVEQCSELRGLTKVVISRIGSRVVDTKLTSITFNVNLCEDMSYLSWFDQHIKDLVYHEIAHYVYYLKDSTSKNFIWLCRDNSTIICSKKDFVTEYSQTAGEEDYAETFQYWYQKKITPTLNTTLDKKFNYFNMLFKRT